MATTLIHHAANRGHDHPPNSLRSLRHCLEAGALIVEVDVTPLAGGDFALLHDGQLESTTDGTGPAFALAADQVRRLQYTCKGVATGERVGLLGQAISLIHDYPNLQELQLDLKPHVPLDADVLRDLLRVIRPVTGRTRVTSVADWALRRLRALDADLSLGFDPLLYLDVEVEDGRDGTIPPFRVGAYGYRDDHPLAIRPWGTSSDYLAARAEALAAQAPDGATWYISASLLKCALDDGFDWIAYLHAQGTQVTAWTLDVDQPERLALARRLIEMGIDRVTTNDAPHLAMALDHTVEF
ncbi:MAG: glycerophosphodiester phosphodiesterase family protein [Chloroflexota bacterium]|nr:glycerophosphodiester phosphodiesterase family protein [Chloroflexota bacterium]